MAPPALPSPAVRHVVDRFSFGITPALADEVRRAGPNAWFERQLTPGKIDDVWTDRHRAWFPAVGKTPEQIKNDNDSGVRSGYESCLDVARHALMQRTYSRRSLYEHMVALWSDMLHVPLHDDSVWATRPQYDAVVRRYAMGNVKDLLYATTTHPAMLSYLDTTSSSRFALNENHGRELLELHTVGLRAKYTERDVRDSARILTGWKVDTWPYYTYTRYYVPGHHYTGRVKVLGFTHDNRAQDGREVARKYLAYLARHPSTAWQVARRICVRFVSDRPSANLVNAVATAYRRSDCDIKATLRAMYRHPEFAKSIGKKAKTPVEDLVSTYRAMGVRAARPVDGNSLASGLVYIASDMGHRPYAWPAPNGYPDTALEWGSVGGTLVSLDRHSAAVWGWWPAEEATFPGASSYMGRFPARFDTLVDRAARRILMRPATPAMIAAAAAVAQSDPKATYESIETLGTWRAGWICIALLNTPQHMRR